MAAPGVEVVFPTGTLPHHDHLTMDRCIKSWGLLGLAASVKDEPLQLMADTR
jgi:hypothetical protein